MSKPARDQKFLVAAAMRNEGAFLLEWVCWYRMLGFDVLVVTNDCTDHSPDLLRALEAAGWISYREHTPNRRQHPKRSAHGAMRRHPAVKATDWLLICDVDEFLVLHKADTIAEYVAGFTPPPLGFGFHWKCFGFGDNDVWDDVPLHRAFQRAAPRHNRANVCFKSMFRRVGEFRKFSAHSPRGYTGPWEDNRHVWVDGSGKRLWRFQPFESPQKATAPNRVDHGLAQMNHYIMRFRDSFELKRGTPSASAGVDRYDAAFCDRFDRNEVEDKTALRFADAFEAIHTSAMALPDVRRLHHLCCADYVARLAAKQGKMAKDERRHALHADVAKSAKPGP